MYNSETKNSRVKLKQEMDTEREWRSLDGVLYR